MKKLIPLLAATFLALSSFAQDQHKKDSLFTALKTAKEDTNKVRLLVQYGYTLESQSRDSLIYYLRKALELSKKTDYKKATVICFRNIAQYHESNSLSDSAIFYTMMWLTTAKELNDSIWIGQAFLNLSYLERNISNANLPLGSKKGMMYLDSAISYANNDKVILREAFSRKSEIYTEQKKFDDAKYFLQQAINLTSETDMDLNLSVNLAYILIETGRADSAVTIFSSLLERDKRKPFLDIRSKSYLYAMIANAYMKLKNFKLAVENGETGLKLAIDNHLTKERLDNLDILYQIYAAKNDYENALYYFKQHRDYSDSLSAYTSKSSDANFQNQLKAERNQQQIILLEKENEKQKLVRNGFIAGFALMLLFVGLVFTQRNKIKKGKKLSDELLLNILPSEMAEELKANGTTKAKAFTMVTVMFTDFKDFTTVSEKVSAELLVAEIHHCFSAFDRIIQKYKIEKIKTIGDSYMAVGGNFSGKDCKPLEVVSAG
ncbi:MAG: adenylate/guanylate cyclase domain-containing protein, partial [Bdellovibrionales bacterium]